MNSLQHLSNRAFFSFLFFRNPDLPDNWHMLINCYFLSNVSSWIWRRERGGKTSQVLRFTVDKEKLNWNSLFTALSNAFWALIEKVKKCFAPGEEKEGAGIVSLLGGKYTGKNKIAWYPWRLGWTQPLNMSLLCHSVYEQSKNIPKLT